MSMLIKSDDINHGFIIQKLITPAADLLTDKPSGQASNENLLSKENKRLSSLLEVRDAEISGHKLALEKAYANGEEAGRSAMEAEIDDDRSASLALLSEGIDAARADLGHALEKTENIAFMVAQMTLDKIFGEAEGRKTVITDLIRHQFQKIGHDSFIALEVSRVDFPNTNEVAELAAELSIIPDKVRVSDIMEAGDCRMRMQLGTLEIGLRSQWGAIRTLLTNMTKIGVGEVTT